MANVCFGNAAKNLENNAADEIGLETSHISPSCVSSETVSILKKNDHQIIRY